MNDLQKRFVLFLTACMGTRFLFAFLAKKANKSLLLIMGVIALLLVIGFFYLFFTGKRKIGIETFGAKIWWNNLRPIHGILYILFAIYAIRGDTRAWWFLLLDVIFGLISFIVFHIFIGD